MRRALMGLAVAALTVVSLAVPASAAAGQVTHLRFSGTLAEAYWSVGPQDATTETYVAVSQSRQGSQLAYDRFAPAVDASGTVTYKEVFADVTDGFTSTVDTARLTGASVSGTGLAATECTFDADGNEIGCSPTTIDVSVNWTGQGAIGRQVANTHFKRGAYSFRSHLVGTNRDATAAGTFTGPFGSDSLTADGLQWATLSNTREAETTICIGGNC